MMPRIAILFFALGLCSCTAQRNSVTVHRQPSGMQVPGDDWPKSEPVVTNLSDPEVLPAGAQEPVRIERAKGSSTVQAGATAWDATLDQTLEYALANHPTLRARQQEVSAARAQLVTAGLLPNPNFVMDTRTPVEGGSTDLSTRLVFTIPTGGKIKRRESVAQAAIVRASYQLSQETQQVLIEVARASLDVLYLQERLALRDGFVEVAESVVNVQRTRAEQGDISEQELLIAELDAARVEAARLNVVTRLEESRATLAQAVGLIEPRPIGMLGELPSDPLPSVPLETLLACARQVLPELSGSRAAVSQSQQEMALARAEAIPDVELGPRYRDSLGNSDDRVGARFSMQLPIFDRNQGDIAQSRAQIHRARALLDAAENTTLSNLAALHAQLTVLDSRLEFFDERILPLADRLETMIRRAYESGDINAYEMSLQLQALNQVREDHLELRYLYSQLRVRLDLLLGDCLANLPDPAPLRD